MSGAIVGSMLHLETRRLATGHGPFDVSVYRNLANGGCALGIGYGDVTGPAPVVARVHSSCVTSEVFGSCDCDCVEQLDAALAAIAEAGRGVLFYLLQEGRGAGFTAKVRDRMLVQASGERLTTFEAYRQLGLVRDQRSYEEVAAIGALLGIEAPLTLLTGNPEKIEALERCGVTVAGTVPFGYAASPFNAHYLRAKSLEETAGRPAAETAPAALPEPVDYFDPFVPEGMPGMVCTASYLLPIAPLPRGREHTSAGPTDVHWFRLHAYFDLHANHERAVLTYGAGTAAPHLVRVQTTPLLDRIPRVEAAMDKRRWHATVRTFLRHGGGCAVFRVAERADIDVREDDDGEAVSWLLAHHLGGRRARPVFDAPDVAPRDTTLVEQLRARGLTVDPPLFLGPGDVDAF